MKILLNFKHPAQNEKCRLIRASKIQFSSILHRIWGPSWGQLRPKIEYTRALKPPRTVFHCSKTAFFCHSMRTSNSATVLQYFWPPKPSKNQWKSNPKTMLTRSQKIGPISTPLIRKIKWSQSHNTKGALLKNVQKHSVFACFLRLNTSW